MTDPASTALAAPRLALGDGAAAYEAAVERARTEDWATRLFDRDATLWIERSAGRRGHRRAARLARRAGALRRPDRRPRGLRRRRRRRRASRPRSWPAWAAAASPRTSCTGRSASQRGLPRPAHPRLDRPGRTSAATVDDLDPLRTLVIVASKSGTTTEPNAFLADAWDRAEQALDGGPAPRLRARRARYFAAITDPGRASRRSPTTTSSARSSSTRPTSAAATRALTYVGLVPASLIGLDLDALLASAAAMLGACREPDPARNPGVSLGLAIGHAGEGRPRQADVPRRRRDRELRGVGRAAHRREHRQARRRDRAGRPRAARRGRARTARTGSSSGSSLAGSDDGGRDALADALEAAGHPVIRIELADPIDLGAEFVRWEVATAIAGAVLGIDPFDQPNVEEAKELTRDVLATAEHGEAPRRRRRRRSPSGDGLTLYGDAALRLTDGRRRRRRRARPPPRPAPRRRLPRASRRSSPRPPAATRRIARIRAAAARPDATRDDGRLRPALPALDRPAPQGRRADRLVPPADRRPPGRPRRSRAGRTRSASSSTPRPPATSRAIESHDLPILRVHLGADPDAGLAALERALDGRARHDHGGLIAHAHRVHRSRPDGGQHGPPARPRRPRDRRLQPDAGEDQGDRRRGRDAVVLDRGARRRSSRSRGRSGSWSRPATPPRPRSTSCSSTSSRATRSSTAATRTSTTTSAATPTLKAKGIHYVDAGTSGGIWGLQVGYCLMVGGDADGGRAARADLHVARARRAATSTSAVRAPGTT